MNPMGTRRVINRKPGVMKSCDVFCSDTRVGRVSCASSGWLCAPTVAVWLPTSYFRLPTLYSRHPSAGKRKYEYYRGFCRCHILGTRRRLSGSRRSCRAMSCCVMLRPAMICNATLCYATLRCAMLRHAALCYAMLYYAL